MCRVTCVVCSYDVNVTATPKIDILPMAAIGGMPVVLSQSSAILFVFRSCSEFYGPGGCVTNAVGTTFRKISVGTRACPI